MTELTAAKKWFKKTVEDAVESAVPGMPVYQDSAPTNLGVQFAVWSFSQGIDDHAGKARITSEFPCVFTVITARIGTPLYAADDVAAAVDGALQGANEITNGVHIRAKSDGSFDYPEPTAGFGDYDHLGCRYTLTVSKTEEN